MRMKEFGLWRGGGGRPWCPLGSANGSLHIHIDDTGRADGFGSS